MISLRPRLLKLSALSIAIAGLGLAFVVWPGGGTPVSAQEPSPTATPTRTATPSPSPTTSGTPLATQAPSTAATTTPSCDGTIRGGQTIPTVGGTTVTLPAGEDFGLIINPPGAGDPTFTICHEDTEARVTINAATCREISESIPAQGDALMIARIVESCRTSATAGATAVSGQTPSAIAPPNTGDAGLR